jgi:hypothetical protein
MQIMTLDAATPNASSPILVVENQDVALPRIGAALRKAGIHNPLIILPDAAEASHYLDGIGDYSNRKKHPLPGLLLLDVTLPRLDCPGTPLWLTPPASRHIVVADICGTTDPRQFKSAVALGANAIVCKLSFSDLLDSLCEELRRTWVQDEKFSIAHAA